MSATKYQVMYRYMNAIMNVAITNDQSNQYDPVCEFYTDPDHRIFSPDVNIQNEELDKQQNIIIDANQADNPKNDMLFVYGGTKKIPHQVYVASKVGYVVKHWELIPRSKIGDNGDFGKDFTTINGLTPEDGGTVVCTEAVMKKYFTPGTVVGEGNYTSAQMAEMLDSYTIFQLIDKDWRNHAAARTVTSVYSNWQITNLIANVCSGTIYVDDAQLNKQAFSGYITYNGSYRTINGIPDTSPHAENVFNKVTLDFKDLETVDIPEHYEDSPENPYMIKDVYNRIEDSPWMINCITGSLTAALTKAQKIVDVLGIENVKVIKLVHVDQFIKIK